MIKKIKTTFLTLAIGFLFSNQASAQAFTTDDPVEYSDYIITMHKNFNEAMINYTIESVHSENPVKNENLRINILKMIDNTMDKLNQLQEFRGDGKLRDEAKEVFKLYKESFSIDFPKVDQLQANKEDSFEAMENYMKENDQAEEKLQKTSKRFQNAHEAYAKKYDITLIAAEKDDRITAISETNKYSRAIFLQFFRVSRANSEYNDAVASQKTSLMESKRKNLINEGNAALVAIKNVAPLNGDKQYRGAAIEYIEYHQNLAKNEFAEMIAVIKKDPTERTQEDVDRYNAISQEYNEQNIKLVNNFNKASAELLKTNIPKQ